MSISADRIHWRNDRMNRDDASADALNKATREIDALMKGISARLPASQPSNAAPATAAQSQAFSSTPPTAAPSERSHETPGFFCVHCSFRIPSHPKAAGSRVICPSCGASVTAPAVTHPVPPEVRSPDSRSVWQQALPAAYKAATFGGLVGIASVFRSHAALSFGDRLLFYVLFGGMLSAIFFAVVYVIALIIYAGKR